MSREQLAAELAKRVLGWRVAPDRFLLSDRQWKPRHYFQPIDRLSDAFFLLQAASIESYTIQRTTNSGCVARVQIDGKTGTAEDSSEARAITIAVARALGIGEGGRA